MMFKMNLSKLVLNKINIMHLAIASFVNRQKSLGNNILKKLLQQLSGIGTSL